MTRQERQEKIATALFAADDNSSVEHAERMMKIGRDSAHRGDCTGVSMTCMRCEYEHYRKMATDLEAHLETFGLSIAEAILTPDESDDTRD